MLHKLPKLSTIKKHPSTWTDSEKRHWLFQNDLPLTEEIERLINNDILDERLKIVYIHTSNQQPPSQDELIQLQRKNAQSIIISISDIHHQSGFKSWAFVETVDVV
jgi:hypothetical protein